MFVNSVNQQGLSIQFLPASSLKPYQKNARTHSKHQIRQMAESIRILGFTNAILVDAENQIIAGHGRVEAAKSNGITEVPTIRLDRLTLEQIRAYMLADNRLAENAGWDKDILTIEFQELLGLDSANFDVTVTVCRHSVKDATASIRSIPLHVMFSETVKIERLLKAACSRSY